MAKQKIIALPKQGIYGFIFPILGILIMYSGYNYATNLTNCSCVNPQDVKHIKTIEMILLIIMLFGAIVKCMIFYHFTSLNPLIEMFKTYTHLQYMYGIYILFILCTYIYFITNVYDFGKTMQPNCSCAQKWQLNILYGQAILYFCILFILFTAALGLMYAVLRRK